LKFKVIKNKVAGKIFNPFRCPCSSCLELGFLLGTENEKQGEGEKKKGEGSSRGLPTKRER